MEMNELVTLGFDFAGTYTKVVENQLIECTFGTALCESSSLPGAAG